MNKNKKTALVIILSLLIITVFNSVVKKIAQPVKFTEEKKKNEEIQNPPSLKDSKEEIIEKKGKYLNHDFFIMNKKGDDKYVATFTPFLPRDYATVLGAIFEAINLTYGKRTITNLEPQMENRNGTNLLKFNGTNGSYYVLLIKEGTGEVHSFTYWLE
ncbi:MAG TPA: hypothetical protein VMW29_01845 [Candidatus Bathyarchaeia archaeon]|nr:hypothetical protein [Candidatus Bathyarchaeia archaeon]